MKTILVLLITCISVSAQTFFPSQDAYVSQYNPNTNFGAEGSLVLFSNLFNFNNIARSLVEFDLSSIPQGTPVIYAVFHVYMYNQAGTDFDVDIHRVLMPWLEMDVNWNNQPAHDTNIVATLPYQGYDWWHFNITDLVQLWINEPGINHGFKMKFRIEQYPDSLGRTAYFYSRDTSFNQPHLDLTLGVEEHQTNELTTLSLAPNPASRSTTLKMNSPYDGSSRIALYDIQGRLIRVICEDSRLIGDRELSIDVKTIPVGIYFLKINTNDHQHVIPLVVIR